jgi:hypothetical protein
VSFRVAELHSAADGWDAWSHVFDPVERRALVDYAAEHAVFVAGDNPSLLLATAVASHARELIASDRSLLRDADGRFTSVAAKRNMAATFGPLHGGLGHVNYTGHFYRPIVDYLWQDCFSSTVVLAKRPRPERMLRILTVSLAGWIIVRDSWLPSLRQTLDVQERYVWCFFELHVPIAVMLYVLGRRLSWVASFHALSHIACCVRCFLFFFSFSFSLEARGDGTAESFRNAVAVFQVQ